MTKFAQLISPLALIALVTACATNPQQIATPTEAAPQQSVAPWAPQYYNAVPMPSKKLDDTQTIQRITFGSCFTPLESDAIWTSVEAAKADAFLFIGDNVYGDVHSNDPGMPELRDKYGKLAASKTFAALRASTPLMTVWDDHDFGKNDGGANFALRRQAEDLFNYVWDVPEDDQQRTHPGVYSAKIIGNEDGKRVQVILLDTRYFRSDLVKTDDYGAWGKERYLPNTDPSATMLGDAQWQWLREELEKPADVRLLVSSIQVLADGHGWEAWKTMPLEREKLFSTINASGASGVILLSGDRHAAAFYRKDLALTYPLYEMTSSSLNLPASKWRAESGETRMEDGPFRLTDMYYDANFGAIDFNWQDRLVTLTLMDGAGNPVQSQTVRLDDLVVGN